MKKCVVLTSDSENMSLDHLVVPLGLTAVISGMEELDFVEHKRPVRKYPDLVFLIEAGQVEPVATPYNWHGQASAHVTSELDVFPYIGCDACHFEGLVQRDDGNTCDRPSGCD